MRLLPATSVVCVIDVQERLLAAIPEGETCFKKKESR